MSLLKSLGAESLFGDVQRMDKRQVSEENKNLRFHNNSRIIKKNSF